MVKLKHQLVITAADLQHTVTLPANTRRIQLRSESGTTFRLSFVPGEVEILKGTKVLSGVTVDTGYLHHSPTYLYLSSPIPGNLILLEIQVGTGTRIENIPTTTELL